MNGCAPGLALIERLKATRKWAINRGKRSWIECVEFVRGGGVFCDYCECAPVHHEKLTDPNSEAT